MFKVGEGDKSLQLQRFLQFVPVAGSRELEGKAAKREIHLLERVLRGGVAIVSRELR